MDRELFRLLTFVLILAGNSGCLLKDKSPPPFGSEFNLERKKIGLPVIPLTWRPSGEANLAIYAPTTPTGTVSVGWNNPVRFIQEEKKGIHAQKVVFFRLGEVIAEEDVYYTGENYHLIPDNPETDSAPESLIITYYFLEPLKYPPYPKKGWNCLLNDADNPSGKVLTLREAEAVLRKWGINRLEDSDETGE